MAALRVKLFLTYNHKRRARGGTGRKYQFSRLRSMTQPGFEPKLPTLVAPNPTSHLAGDNCVYMSKISQRSCPQIVNEWKHQTNWLTVRLLVEK